MKAIWKNKTIAESDDTLVIEGNHYFPKESVNMQYFQPSELHTTCPWKGQASYFDVLVDGEANKDAAWYYPNPKPTANDVVGKDFSNYVAFWRGVEVVE